MKAGIANISPIFQVRKARLRGVISKASSQCHKGFGASLELDQPDCQ